MTDDERYLFDINGYLVVRAALPAEDVALANAAIDRHAGEIRERVGEDSLSRRLGGAARQHRPRRPGGCPVVGGSRTGARSATCW